MCVCDVCVWQAVVERERVHASVVVELRQEIDGLHARIGERDGVIEDLRARSDASAAAGAAALDAEGVRVRELTASVESLQSAYDAVRREVCGCVCGCGKC